MRRERVRVLIVEEDPDARAVLASLVAAEPKLELTDAVADAAQAIFVAMRVKPAVAVLDVHIPGRRRHGGAGHQALLACDARARAVGRRRSRDSA